MDKKIFLDISIKRIIAALVIADCILIFGIIMQICGKETVFFISVSAFIILTLSGLLYYFFRAYIPYRSVKNIYENITEENECLKIFDKKIYIFKEEEEVLQKLQLLINQSNLLNAVKQQAQYLALQNQINPHFLYNTLESIRSDALCCGMDDIAKITEALSLFFRYTISGLEKTSTIIDELENVENYFIIQKYRFEDRLKLIIEMPDDEHMRNLKLPKLTLQPLVENAIIHGVECYADQGIIKISVEMTDKWYYITVEDNGIGIPIEQLKELNEMLSYPEIVTTRAKSKKGGIAMGNVAQRIRLLYGKQYGIHVYSTVGIGTKVVVNLPKEFAEEL